MSINISKNDKEKLEHFADNNLEYFIETMELIKEHAPAEYARLYCQAVKMGMQKESIRLSFFARCKRRLRHLLIRLVGFRVFFRLYQRLF